MTVSHDPASSQAKGARATWADLFRGGRAFPMILLNLGIMLNAVDVFIISAVMPTVVADIGGTAYYAWAVMLYMLGTIVGAASGGPLHVIFGRRNALVCAAMVFLAGSIICATSQNMGWLLIGRLIEGLGGGLIVAQSMALVAEMFEPRLRVKVLAFITGAWGAAALLGPMVGGVAAEFDFWRGAFWALTPFITGFGLLAWRLVPPHARDPEAAVPHFPIRRLLFLGAGILCVGFAGQVSSMVYSGVLVVVAAIVVWATLQLDAGAKARLFPSHPLSIFKPVGAANWVFFMISISHTAVLVFFPLKLQQQFGISPLTAAYYTAFLSFGWTAGSFIVASWTGRMERVAMVGGLVLMSIGMIASVTGGDATDAIWLTGCIFVVGLGIGASNVHFTAQIMSAALKGEESITASSITTLRSIGIAFGAALAGIVANAAGLDEGVSLEAVITATDWVFTLDIIPPMLGVLAAIQFLRLFHAKRASAN